ncbi:MAG: ImmA/IrrE family metallo-endopeptidase [Firmicutes bacterium]|nr:ImmA/IrrE family metallo-endopeptidase [Bacillota bacterium]
MPFKATGMSVKKIQQEISYIRNVFGLRNALYFPIIPFVEKVLYNVFDDYTFDVVPFEELGEKHGETLPDEHTIKIREDIYLRAVAGNGRDRLTIAHEIGHLFMHDKSHISFCRLGNGQKLPAYEDPEWQADCFGGELLAPAYLIKDMDIADIMRQCGITFDAAKNQLKHAIK